MKKLSYIGISILIAVTAVISFSCEKDDICSEGTLATPLLVIEFFDADDTTGEDVAKTVTNLWVETVDPNLDQDMAIVDPIQSAAQTISTVSIPLRTQQSTTEYRFISDYELDDDDNQLGNEDIITFNHETQEIFLSRACGYITNYTLEDAPDITVDTDNWIDPTTGIIVAVQIVENETETHVKIYH
jgi:hypothetical protein